MKFRIPFLEKFPVRVVLLQKRGDAVTARLDKGRYIIKQNVPIYELKKYGIKFQPSSYENLIPLTSGQPFVILYEYDRGMVVPVSTNNMQIIYEYDENGIIEEEVNYECENHHTFSKPETKKKRRQKEGISVCPYCETEVLSKFEKPQKRPKIKKIVNLHAVDEDMRLWGQMRRWKAEERHKNEGWLQRNQQLVMSTMLFVFFIVLAYLFMQSISDNTNSIVTALQGLRGSAPPG